LASTEIKIYDTKTTQWIVGSWSDLSIERAYEPKEIITSVLYFMRQKWIKEGGKDFNIRFEYDGVLKILGLELSYKE